jgi:hypothetical protein
MVDNYKSVDALMEQIEKQRFGFYSSRESECQHWDESTNQPLG